MKSKFFTSIALVLCCFVYTSCSKHEVYSCDPDVNEWTIANIDYYANASRSEIVSLPIERQRAIYLALPGDKKLSLWKAKYATLMTSDNFSNEEKQGLSDLYNYAKAYHFETESGRVEFNEFAEQWVKRMHRDFGWTEEDFFFAACTWMTEKEIKDAVLESGKIRSRMSTPIVDDLVVVEGSFKCDCTTDIYCSTFGEGGDCERSTDDCDTTERGCGILGNSECDGACEDRLILA